MKKVLLFIVLLVTCTLGLNSCKTGTFASEGGKEDMAYLQVFSGDEYANKTVTVTVDNETSFDVKVVKTKQLQEKRNGKLYGIRPGKRHVKVTYQGKTIYEKDIFTSSQQTKTITL